MINPCVFFRSFSHLKSPSIGGIASYCFPICRWKSQIEMLVYSTLFNNIFPIQQHDICPLLMIDSLTLSVESVILISKYHHGPIDCWHYPAISPFWVAKKKRPIGWVWLSDQHTLPPHSKSSICRIFLYFHQQKPAKIAALPPWWRTRTTLSSPGTKVASVASGLRSKRLASSSVRSANPEKIGIETGKRWKIASWTRNNGWLS